MNFRLVSEKQLVKLHEHPDTVDAFLFGADDEPTIAHDPSHDFELHEPDFDLDGGRPLGEARTYTAAQVVELITRLHARPELKNFLAAGAAKRMGLVVYG